MVIGIPKEVKLDEYRVSITPAGVMALKAQGHNVLVQRGAGEGSYISDTLYAKCGAEILEADEVWERSEMILKVKEPQPSEFNSIKPNQILFTYFHFAANEPLTKAMIESKAHCIAYETVTTPQGTHPLLTPMSEVAGRISIQEGAKFLEKPMGGRGILLSGVPGVKPAVITVIGGGIVGINAAKVAAGSGAKVYVLDVNIDRLRYLDDIFPSNVITLHSNSHTLEETLSESDLVIGAVYLTGRRTPVLVNKETLKYMKSGSVIVDVCVDQGGCFETTRPTTHKEPTYVIDDIVHYAVANMPGAVPLTSTYALTNATLPYVLKIAGSGLKALQKDETLRHGLNISQGEVCQKAIAEQFGYTFADIMNLIG